MNDRPSSRPLRRGERLVPIALCVVACLSMRVAAQCGGGGISTDPIPYQETLRSYRAEFGAPARLAVDDDGNVFVADPAARKVVVRAPSGSLVDVATGLGKPLSVAVAPGRVFVGDGDTGSVRVFTRDFRPLRYIGQGPGEFQLPADIGIDTASGNIWVVDTTAHHIKIFDADGSFVRTVGARGAEPGNFAAPTGLFIDQERSRVVVADQLNARLQIFDLAGDYVSCIGSRGGLPGEFITPQAVWVDPDGRFYVADSFEGRVQILDAEGSFIDYLGDIGDALGRLRQPGDILIDPAGRLFVASTGTSRLEVFGVGAFSDPETTIPVFPRITPNPFRPRSDPFVEVAVEVPGYDFGLIDAATFSLNGVAASDGTVRQADPDGDAIPDLIGRFDAAATAATLPLNGTLEVRVAASLGELQFAGSAELTVLGGEDADGDRVPDDIDLCPGSYPHAITDAQGCSLEQRCPCDGPRAGADDPSARATWQWKMLYIRCVARESWAFVDQGLITASEREHVVRKAAGSRCGDTVVDPPRSGGVPIEWRIR